MRAVGVLVAMLVPLCMLFIAGVWHASHRPELRSDLREQAILPTPWIDTVARVMPAIEIAVGSAGVLAYIARVDLALRSVVGLAAGVYLLYSVYLGIVRRRTPNASCGCGLGSSSSRGWAPSLRTLALLGGLTVVLALGFDADSQHLIGSAPPLLTSLALALIVWVLPDALATPLMEVE